MKLLAVKTPPYICHGCSTRKTFWEEKFTPLSMKIYGRCNVRKHREIKYGEKYIALDISLDFGSLYKIKITSSEPKYYWGRSGKGLITYLGLKTIRRSKKKKKTSYTITNVSLNDISNTIKEFEKLPYEGCVQKRSKHEPTDR